MIIKAVKFRKDGFYSQPFAFDGEEGTDKFDPDVRYRGSLQNYLIDTGDEVILVDTGLPAGTPEGVPADNITVTEDGVHFSDHCEVCYACLHNCPQSAIHMPVEAGTTHYRNEHVTLKDIIRSNG